ncbi:hypothetical protein LINGRAHAP2_LOCUS7459 [Linum grandiflorum]
MALEFGMQLACRHGYTGMEVESDNQVVMQGLRIWSLIGPNLVLFIGISVCSWKGWKVCVGEIVVEKLIRRLTSWLKVKLIGVVPLFGWIVLRCFESIGL